MGEQSININSSSALSIEIRERHSDWPRNSRAVGGPAGRFDFNADGTVNVLDQAIVRANIGRSLELLSPPPATAAMAPADPRRARYRPMTARLLTQ
jgi:hypothetical protein